MFMFRTLSNSATWYCTANRNRSTSLFSPVSSSSDRADVQLQSYHKTYSHQQVFSQQQGTDTQRVSTSSAPPNQYDVYCLVIDIYHFLYGFPRMCVWRRKGGSTSQRWRLWSQLFHKPCRLSLYRWPYAPIKMLLNGRESLNNTFQKWGVGSNNLNNSFSRT